VAFVTISEVVVVMVVTLMVVVVVLGEVLPRTVAVRESIFGVVVVMVFR